MQTSSHRAKFVQYNGVYFEKTLYYELMKLLRAQTTSSPGHRKGKAPWANCYATHVTSVVRRAKSNELLREKCAVKETVGKMAERG